LFGVVFMNVRKRILTIAIPAAFVALSVGLAVTFFPPLSAAPGFDEVRTARGRSESILLDRHAEIIHELRTDNRARKLDWVQLGDVSPALIAAILKAEDQHFYEHHGVDWTSLAGAIAGVFGSGARGASTITMQLAAQLDEELRPARLHRTLWQKWQQVRGARSLERRWTKAEILEAYLNLVTYRGELQGLAAASGGLLGKRSHGLTDVESVFLAALVRSPNSNTDLVARRSCALAVAMNLPIRPADIIALAGETLSRPYFIRPQAALAPHVAQRLIREARGRGEQTPQKMTCALDGSLQQFSLESLRRHLMTVRDQNVRDGAVLVLDNRSGEILAYVGNTGEQGSARYVDGVQAPRQAGSTLKPFIYGAAIERRVLTAASLLDDSPLDVPAVGGIYRPGNYDKVFHGPVTVRTALASSLNVPAVKALNLIGVDAALQVLRAAGFEGLKPDEFYGSSLALGAADVSLWELAGAYRSLANGGISSPLHLTLAPGTDDGRRVLSAEAEFVVASILSDRESRSQTFNLESPLATRYWTAVKTGTSKDMRDNWCVGFSDRYTVAVWAGNFSGAPMWNVSGITGAAPVWVEIMNWLHSRRSSSAPEPPAGVIATAVSPDRREWFLRDTEQSGAPAEEAHAAFRIVYPAAGTIIALDPDIPEAEQKLFFEARPKDDRLRWKLDGCDIGGAGTLALWTPVRGPHELTLVDASSRILDTVNFNIR
jgi:penicillin-binding protein 1C